MKGKLRVRKMAGGLWRTKCPTCGKEFVKRTTRGARVALRIHVGMMHDGTREKIGKYRWAKQDGKPEKAVPKVKVVQLSLLDRVKQVEQAKEGEGSVAKRLAALEKRMEELRKEVLG